MIDAAEILDAEMMAKIKNPDAYKKAHSQYVRGITHLGDFVYAVVEIAAGERN